VPKPVPAILFGYLFHCTIQGFFERFIRARLSASGQRFQFGVAIATDTVGEFKKALKKPSFDFSFLRFYWLKMNSPTVSDWVKNPFLDN
jgi:hypothetical protein